MRAVMADYVIFEECIAALYENLSARRAIRPDRQLARGCLLLDFNLRSRFDFEHLSLLPSEVVELSWPHCAYVSMLELGEMDPFLDGVRESIAISAVFSFAMQRVVAAPRHNVLVRYSATNNPLVAAGLCLPVLVAGPGGSVQEIDADAEKKAFACARRILAMLMDSAPGDFAFRMRVLRLLQLANDNLRKDFSLAYSLLVAAIEAVAQAAIPVKRVRPRNEHALLWKQKATSDREFAALFKAYCDHVASNRYLGARFVEFILEYCPLAEWSALEHPDAEWERFMLEKTGSSFERWPTPLPWDTMLPCHLDLDHARRLLGDVYSHRSKFMHTGAPPPHRDPASSSHYFETIPTINGNGRGVELVVVPTYRLLYFIGHRAISRYFGIGGDGDS